MSWSLRIDTRFPAGGKHTLGNKEFQRDAVCWIALSSRSHQSKNVWVGRSRLPHYQYEEPGPNFIELLSTKIFLAWNFFLDKTKFPRDFQDKQSTAEYQYQALHARNGNFAGNPVFNQGRNFMLSKCLCLAALWN